MKSLRFRYYRFNSPRILSKLLMSDEGGCDKEYPGIGNIAYVKDLISRKITTTNFKCSRFGAYIMPGVGWVCVPFSICTHVLFILIGSTVLTCNTTRKPSLLAKAKKPSCDKQLT